MNFPNEISLLANSPEQYVVNYLQGVSAQQRLNNFLENQTKSELLRLFDEIPDSVFHPEIDQIFGKIADEKSWGNLDQSLNDIAVIAFQELFDVESGKLKKNIKDAINSSDPNKIDALESLLGEEFNQLVLEAYFIKMALNSCAPHLQELAMQGEEMQHFVSAINLRLRDSSTNLDFHLYQRLASKCIGIGKAMFSAFHQWEEQHEPIANYPDQIGVLLYEIKKIVTNGEKFILAGEVQQCESLIAQIQMLDPEFPFGNFEHIVDNGYQSLMKKEFYAHKSHTDKAYMASLNKHLLREELKQLHSDLDSELRNLQEKINVYHYVLEEEKNKNDITFVEDLVREYDKLKMNLVHIENRLTNNEITEQHVVRLKLSVVSDVISLSQAEIILQQKNLDSRKDGETEHKEVKLTTLQDFNTHLQKQKEIINDKLSEPRILRREDIASTINAIAEKRKEVQNVGFIHCSWFFAFLAKLGFHVKTRTEETIATAENRLGIGGSWK